MFFSFNFFSFKGFPLTNEIRFETPVKDHYNINTTILPSTNHSQHQQQYDPKTQKEISDLKEQITSLNDDLTEYKRHSIMASELLNTSFASRHDRLGSTNKVSQSCPKYLSI